jgi:hypothetical protein
MKLKFEFHLTKTQMDSKVNHKCGLGSIDQSEASDFMGLFEMQCNAHPCYYSNPYYLEKYKSYYLDMPRDLRQQYFKKETQ